MSNESAVAFRAKISETPELQEKVRAVLQEGNDLSAAVALGKAHGFDFTVQEIQAVVDDAQDGELSDFELAVVAGGTSKTPANQGHIQEDRVITKKLPGIQEDRVITKRIKAR